MIWQNTALAVAGVIGAVVAIFHGVVVQRRIVEPFAAFALVDGRFSGVMTRLIPPLLHFSTMIWFVGGVALIAAAVTLDREVRLAISILVGITYLLGAVFNFWATRGRHPGWMLLTVALLLIAVAAMTSGL